MGFRASGKPPLLWGSAILDLKLVPPTHLKAVTCNSDSHALVPSIFAQGPQSALIRWRMAMSARLPTGAWAVLLLPRQWGPFRGPNPVKQM